MGTTGLVAWVVAKRFGKRRSLARATAERILRGRYANDEAVTRFRGALAVAENAEMAREVAAYRAACEAGDRREAASRGEGANGRPEDDLALRVTEGEP